MDKVLPTIRNKMRKDAVLLSIVAGYPIDKLAELTEHSLVVRAMPNTPALVGAGMTVWLSSKAMDSHHCDYVRHMLARSEKEFIASPSI